MSVEGKSLRFLPQIIIFHGFIGLYVLVLCGISFLDSNISFIFVLLPAPLAGLEYVIHVD